MVACDSYYGVWQLKGAGWKEHGVYVSPRRLYGRLYGASFC